eukprot:scaffold153912_cov17-Prasinocladus_malaysianus.AAC.1
MAIMVSCEYRCDRDHISHTDMGFACTSPGVKKYGRPVSLDDKLEVGLVIVGSVAVNPQNGCRIGKGEDAFVN